MTASIAPPDATYTLGEVIHVGPRSLLRHAVRDDGRRVVLKAVAPGASGGRARQRLRHEHEMLARATGDGVVRAHGLAHTALGLALVLDALEGEPLRARLAHAPWPLDAALDLGLRVAVALQHLHAHGVAHLDLTPDHVVLGRDGAVTLVDLGRASAVPLTFAESFGRSVAELAWLAPEQTGRIDRPADARADLYALGVMLYRALSGRLPFDDDDPLALVHAVVARAPVPLRALRPELPAVVEGVVHRLLQKSPDERYQSAAGVARDLDACLNSLRAAGHVADFEPGRADRASTLRVPAALYGRDDERRALDHAVAQVLSGHAPAVAVVGPAGIGKTRLVRELRGWARARGGLFASGKFDPLLRAEAFGAVRDALDAALRQLLAQGERRVQRWQQRVGRALEGAAGVLVPLVPALAGLLPDAGDARPSHAGEAQARQVAALTELLRAMHAPEAPLVLTIDDTQWADAASLDLLESLLRAPDARNPVLVLTWRSEETPPGHPLASLLDRLGERGPARVTVAPLRPEHVTAMLVDALGAPEDEVRSLAARLTERAEGNPLHLRELLEALARDGALAFDDARGRWVCALEDVERVAAGRGVRELLLRRFDALPEPLVALLSNVACFGQSVELGVLALALARPAPELAREAEALVARGLLVASGEGWALTAEAEADDDAAPRVLAFPHDRVQEAALARLAPDERARAHHAFARRLWDAGVGRRSAEGMFLVAEQAKLGRAAAIDPGDRDDTCARLASASLEARARGAFGTALAFASEACAMLDAGARAPTGRFALHLAAAESAMALGDREAAEAHVAAGEAHAPDDLARVALERVRIRGHMARGEHEAAVDRSCAALARLGMGTPRHPRAHHLGVAFARVLWAMRGATRASLAALPVCDDPRVTAALSLMTDALLSAYLCEPNLTGLWTFELVLRTMRHGVTPQGAFAIASYAFVRAAMLHDVEGAAVYGAAAYDVIERLGAREMLARVEVMEVGFVQSRLRPQRELVERWPSVTRHGLESGDMTYAVQATTNLLSSALTSGVELDVLERRAHEAVALARRAAQDRSVEWARLFLQVVDNLSGRVSDPLALRGEHIDGDAWADALLAIGDKAAPVVYGSYVGLVRLWLGAPTEAVKAYARAEPDIAALPGSHNVPELVGYAALARAGAARVARSEGRAQEARQLHAQARRGLRELAKWLRPKPVNFAQVDALLRAELADLDGRWDEAARAYDAAIAKAAEVDHAYDRALALELAGLAWLRRGHGRAAATYLYDARAAWAQEGVVARLDRFDAPLAAALALGGAGRASAAPPSTPPAAQGLDATAIARAARALSGEIRVEALLGQLLRLAVQTAGATRGALVLVREGTARAAMVARDAGGTLDVRALATAESPEGVDPDAALGALAAVTAYVARAMEPLVVDSARDDARFAEAFADEADRSLLAAPLVRAGELVGIVALEHEGMRGAFNARRLEMVEALAAQAAVSLVNARLYESLQTALDDQRRLTSAYQRFLPVEFMEQLGKASVLDVSVGDQVQGEVSALFADIRGFTTLAERLGPRDTFAFVNRYLAAMEPAIYGHRGHVAQYLGDGIMAVFPGVADDAVQAALAMFGALEGFNAARAAEGVDPVRIGVGINTGSVMVGVIGGRSRLDRGLVGDPVNVASRVEGLCKGYGTSLLISGDTRARLADPSRYAMRLLDRVAASGKEVGTDVYEVLDALPEAPRAARLAARDVYEQGVALWQQERPADARRCFEEALRVAPDDRAAALFAARCAEAERVGMRLGPGKTSRLDWK